MTISREAIPPDSLDTALKQKAPMATRILTQICFDAGTTANWAAGIAAAGIELPVCVGMPGPVNRQKLKRLGSAASTVYDNIRGLHIFTFNELRETERCRSCGSPRQMIAPAGLSTLTERERDVLILIARGRSNREIADELVVAERTARTHVGSILHKLRLSSRTQAALLAVREGLIQLQD